MDQPTDQLLFGKTMASFILIVSIGVALETQC